MFDAEDKRTIAELARVWFVAITAGFVTMVLIAFAAGVAFSVFKLVGGL